MKLADLLTAAERRLKDAGIDNPPVDARLLAGHALKLDRAQLLSQSQNEISADEYNKVEKLLLRRLAHEPVARIFGTREFWSLPFGMNEATLEPRPDSETLIEAALRNLEDKEAPRLLDLGTGTGCLLLSLLHALPTATGLGIDIAPRAVEQAQLNARRLNLRKRSHFQVGNWLTHIDETFDAILCNPPYIPSDDIAGLMPEVRDYDPRRALDGGRDGLEVYQLLAPQMPDKLKPEGFVIFEVGAGQADAVTALCRSAGLKGMMHYQDLNGIPRGVMAWNSL